MKNKVSGLCVMIAILGYVLGVACCFTLILIPLAVYCFIGAKKYMMFSEMSDAQICAFKQSLTNWAIFFSIVGFPIGLLSIIPALMVSSNNVVVSSVNEEIKTAPEQPKEKEEAKPEEENKSNDLETLEKLKHLLDEGLITEEEYERAKKDILGQISQI